MQVRSRAFSEPHITRIRPQRPATIIRLRRLPERQRQVVELHYFDRLKDAQISERLGGSVAAIRVLRCRALKELRRLMEADHDTQ